MTWMVDKYLCVKVINQYSRVKQVDIKGFTIVTSSDDCNIETSCGNALGVCLFGFDSVDNCEY